ncbi:putative uncharacterized protein [Waddlia chondrophila 2032/99]|uniref:Type III secretion chaperone SycD/LcrH n=2 Tax=Waddlia chondrophila TaxID=71667 RepID=D6YTL7_WADCW|nr:hypothetical protein [Waddlia chondrophila]ADI37478.1 hypothetical protein wcw_0103 [Waddlia chondrophila WSU 86-1044]CCB90797.1 putative uncharacterized protein [Waddlia chondrophila 2032/99]
MNDIENLMNREHLEEIVNHYSVEDLIKLLSFKKAMALSKLLLENENFDFDIQEYALNLIKKIRQVYPNKWDKDWKHEAYLGYAYGILGCDIEQEFDAYSIAAKKAVDPPLEISMHMALLWSYPGVYKLKMDEENAIKILENVASQIPYMEAVGGLIRLYEETKQVGKIAYWKEVLRESEKKNLCDRYLYLDFF